MTVVAMALAAALLAGPATAALLWPFRTAGDSYARIQWADGRTSDVLLSGFRYEHPPSGAPAASLPSGFPGAGASSGKLLTPLLRFPGDPDPRLVPPLAFESMAYAPLETRDLGSDTSARCFILGPPDQRIPPPPDWYSAWDNSQLWRPARLAPVDPGWTYLPGAAWLWTSADLQPAMGEKVLFRQRFNVPRDRVVLRAVLWAEADSILEEAYLNGQPLPWAAQVLGGRTVHAFVERLLRPGENLIAVAATAPRSGEIDAAGMAWRLQLLCIPVPVAGAAPEAAILPQPDTPFSVRTLEGGWVPARRVRLQEDSVEVTRPCGDSMTLDRTAVRWIEHWPPSPRFEASAPGSGGVDPPSPAVTGAYDDLAENEGLWTLTGAFQRGHLAEWEPEPDRFTGTPARHTQTERVGDGPAPTEQSVRSVLTSPLPGDLRWDIATPDLARMVHLLLRDGTRLTGLLEPSPGDKITLNLPGDTQATFPAAQAVRIDFPAAEALRARAALQRTGVIRPGETEIGLLGEVPCRGGLGCTESVIPSITRIAQALGQGVHWFKPQELLQPDYFTSQRFPVLLNVDSSESYYHTIQRPGDGHQALLQHMNQGGVLIHLAPGTPFFYGRQAHARQWALVPLGGGLNRAFGLAISGPGAPTAGTLFEVPDNSAQPLTFVRSTEDAWTEGLPDRILFPALSDARFRPVALDPQRAGSTVVPLYRLVRGNTDYGLAAAVARLPKVSDDFPPAYMVYIAWPLAQARDPFGDPLLTRLLPAILEAIAQDRDANQAP